MNKPANPQLGNEQGNRMAALQEWVEREVGQFADAEPFQKIRRKPRKKQFKPKDKD